MRWLQRSLHRRILAALAFVALFSLVTLGIVAYVTQRDVLKEQFSAELNSLVDSKRAQIVTWVMERKSDVTFLGESQFTRQQLAALLSPTATAEEQNSDQTLLREILWGMQRSRADYNRILIADPTGVILVSPEETIVGRKVANLAALEGTLQAGKAPLPSAYVQKIEFNERSGKYEMCFGYAISAPDATSSDRSSIIGVLLITADMNGSIYPILEDWRMGESGTAVLSKAEEQGTRILNQVRFDEAKPLERLLPIEDDASAKPAQLAARGGKGTQIAVDHLGESVMTAYQFIPEVNWGLVLKMNTSEIFAPLHALIMQVLLIALGVLLLATIVSIWIAKTLVNPIDQLLAAIRAVGDGDLSVSVASNRQDEIGILARSFSDMVVKLERHQQQLKAVNEIATGILGARSCGDALYDLVQAACQLTNAEGAAVILDDVVCLIDPPLRSLPFGDQDKSPTISCANGATALFTTGSRSAPMLDLDLHTLLHTISDASPDFVTTPISGRDCQFGTLLLYKHADRRGIDQPLSLADQDTLAALANYAAVIVENARLVTELKRWNTQLETKVAERTIALEAVNEQLTVLDEMKTEFIYNVSHELRNPITNLKLQLDLMCNNPDSSRRERYVASMIKQVDLMAQLVGDMLDLIQIDKMQNQIEFNILDLNPIVTDVTSKYRAQTKELAIHFSVESSEKPLLVIGEQAQLHRAIAHLIRNAVNYTNSGKICVRTFCRNGLACIQVADTGIGIATTDLPYIFQRFYRGTNVSQSAIPGSGLGLSLVREVAKLHHGGLEVESQLNQGSTFCLWFPIREPVSIRSVVAR